MERGLIQAATYGRGMCEINLSPGKTAADFDGDGKTDISVFRPSLGTWFNSQSSNNNLRAAEFGAPGDRAAPSDYDGNQKTDFAVFRPANSYRYLRRIATGEFSAVGFGSLGGVPAPGELRLIQNK